MDDEEARTIGRRVRQIRYARGKSLRVIAGLAGMSKSHLQRIERGERPLDSLSEIAALADALQMAPSDLMSLPAQVSVNGAATDVAIRAVRLALRAATDDHRDGEVVPVQVLRGRVTNAVDALCRCEREAEVGSALPAMVRDLHTTLAAGGNVGELLDLAVVLHTQVTIPWLRLAGAPIDLAAQPLALARHAACEHGTAASLGLAAAAGARVLLGEGALNYARAGLDAVAVPTTTPALTQLAGFLALFHSLVATADNRPADAETALQHAGELAARTGEGNAFGLGFGPANVACWQMAAALKAGDPERAASVADRIRGQLPPNQCRQSAYWIDYGRAAAGLGRDSDAVMALRRVETLSPYRVQRNPVVHDVLAELLPRSKRDAVGRELRGMAYRAGLPA